MSDHARSIVLVAKNSTWNLLAFGSSILSNIILLPYVVKLIGIREFGVCGLLISVSTPLSLIGAILGQTVCQAAARHRAQGNDRAARDACATVWALALLCIPTGAMVLSWLVPLVAAGLVHSGLGAPSLITLALVTAWTAQQVSLLLQGIHVSDMAYRRIAAINIFGAAFNLVSTFLLVRRFPSATGYLAAIGTAQAAAALAWFASILWSYRWCLVRPQLATGMKDSVYEFSGWFTLSQLVAGVAAQADRYVLGAVRSTAAIGYLNVAQRIEEAAYSVMVKAADSLFPYFSARSSEGPVDARFYFTVSWLVNLTAAAAIAPLIPLAPSIIAVWVNSETAQYSSTVLRTLSVAGLIGCASHVFKQYLLGSNRARQFAYLNLASAVGAAVTALLLLPRYGLRAAGLGAACAVSVQLVIVVTMISSYFQALGSAKRIINSIFVPPVLAICLSCGLAWIGIPHMTTWRGLGCAYLVLAAALVVVILTVNSLSGEGRFLVADLRSVLRLSLSEVGRLRGSGAKQVAEVPAREQETMQGIDVSPPL